MATFFIVSFSALVLFLMGSAIVKSSLDRKRLRKAAEKEDKILAEAKNASRMRRTHLLESDDGILDEMHEEMFYLVADVVDTLAEDGDDDDVGMEYQPSEIGQDLGEDKLREDFSTLEVETTTSPSVDESWVDSTYEKPSYTPPSYDSYSSGGSSYESSYDSGGSSDGGGGFD